MGVVRPPFLILPPICVLLGAAVASWQGHSVDALEVVLVLVGALAAHMSVNALNEYFDFKTGLDFRTVRTPFSGGSGTLIAAPELAGTALVIGVTTLLVTMAVGVYFLAARGWGLLPLGLLGVVIIAAYTQWINYNRYLCLVAPGLGFGPLMVVGTYYALTGAYSVAVVVASLVPFFLVSNLLLLNQFPDIDADRSIGRDTFPVARGATASSRIYGAFALATFAVILAAVAAGQMPPASLAALLTVPLAWHAWKGASAEEPVNGEALIPHMRSNVMLSLAGPLLVAVGFLLG